MPWVCGGHNIKFPSRRNTKSILLIRPLNRVWLYKWKFTSKGSESDVAYLLECSSKISSFACLSKWGLKSLDFITSFLLVSHQKDITSAYFCKKLVNRYFKLIKPYSHPANAATSVMREAACNYIKEFMAMGKQGKREAFWNRN